MWTTLIPVFGEILKRVIPDPVERAKAEQKLTEAVHNSLATEATSESWLTRTWRPWMMFMSTNLVLLWGISNFVIRPWVIWFGGDMPTVEVPAEFWNLIMMGFGVYGGARTLEKITTRAMTMMTAPQGNKRRGRR